MFVRVSYAMDSTFARAMLARLSIKLSPPMMTAFMQGAVVPYIQQRAAARFAGEGDDVTGPWHPLTLATQDARRTSGHPPQHPINVRTGQMRAFITGSHGNVTAAPGATQLAYPNSGNMTTLLMRKVATAQIGAQYPPTRARPVLGLNMTDTVAITAMVAGYLT